jgi:hypothetical protein
MGLGILCFIFLLFFLKSHPFDLTDMFVAAKAVILFTASWVFIKYGTETMQHPGKAEKKGVWEILLEVAAIIGLFVAGIVLINHGFKLFHGYAIEKAILFFAAGLIVFFAAFYIADRVGRQLILAKPVFKPHKLKFVAIKIIIAFILSCLGIFFMKTSHSYLALTSFVFVILQLLLVFQNHIPSFSVETVIVSPVKPGVPAKMLSIAMIVSSIYFYYLTYTSMHLYDIQAAILCLFCGSLLFGLAPHGEEYRKPAGPDSTTNNADIYYAVFVFILGLIVFGWKLMDIPPGLHGDETINILMAKRLKSGDILPLVLEDSAFNGLTLLHTWLLSQIGRVFGITMVMARWVSVAVGAAGVSFAYLLAKEIFNRRVGIIVSLLMSTFFMMVLYSRMAHSWIFVPSFAVVTYFFFFKGLKTGKAAFFVAAGVFLSLSMTVYSAGKPTSVVLFFWMILMLVRKETRMQILANWKNIALMLIAALLMFLPVINYIIHNPHKYFQRMGDVTLLHGFPSNYQEFKAIADNILRNIQMFITVSADGYCHNIPGKPFFDEFVSVVAIVGVGYLLFTWKRESSSFLILWIFFGLLPGFLSKLGPEDPYPARTVLAIPALMILISLGLDRLAAKIESFWPKYLKIVSALTVSYFVVWFSFANLRDYFVVFTNDPHTKGYYRSIDKLNADYMTDNKDKQIFISPYLSWNFYYGMSKLLSTPEMEKFISVNDVSLFEVYKVYDKTGRDTTLLGEGIYYKMFPIYREYFPNARITTVWDDLFWQFDHNSNMKYCYEWVNPDKTINLNRGYSWFYLYDNDVKFVKIARVEIPSADQKMEFSLAGVFKSHGKTVEKSSVYFPLDCSGQDFDDLSLSGLLDVPEYGRYEFQIDGARGAIYIDGKPAEGTRELYKGIHRIKFVFKEKTNKFISVKWKMSGSEVFSDLDRRYLINSDKVFGLLADYKLGGRTFYRQLEPVVDYRLYYYKHRPAAAYIPADVTDKNAYDLEWNGQIKLSSRDTYSFRLHTLYDAVIMIDNKVVFKKIKDVEKVIPTVFDQGIKKIRIISHYRYISNYWDPGSTIRFMYKKGDKNEFGPVTYDMLSPGI